MGITNKDGEEFVLESADAFEREANELRCSARFMAFLAKRAAERGRIALEDIESRLTGKDSTETEHAPGG
jgi:hypothetical protein